MEKSIILYQKTSASMYDRRELKITVYYVKIIPKIHFRLWVYHEYLPCLEEINEFNEF